MDFNPVIRQAILIQCLKYLGLAVRSDSNRKIRNLRLSRRAEKSGLLIQNTLSFKTVIQKLMIQLLIFCLPDLRK